MKLFITALVAVHLLVTFWHGNAHETLGVGLSPAQNAFVFVVIVLAPVFGAVLVWTRYVVAGAWIFVLSMLGAFLFGAYFHYVAVSPDHVHHLPNGTAAAQSAFVASAAALAVIEFVSAVYGGFCVSRLRRTV